MTGLQCRVLTAFAAAIAFPLVASAGPMQFEESSKSSLGPIQLSANCADAFASAAQELISLREIAATSVDANAPGIHAGAFPTPVSIMIAAAATSIIPEPSSIVLFGLGGLGAAAVFWRRSRIRK